MKLKLTGIQIIRLVLLLLIAANLVFIFVQSTIPPKESAEKSEEVGNILAEIIPPETPVGEYVQDNVRKIAHFVEFAFLGIWTALYVILKFPCIKWYVLSLASALFCALIDETIQIFSGRGPEISDVWLDFAGFLSSAVIIYTGYIIFSLVRSKMRTKVDKI